MDFQKRYRVTARPFAGYTQISVHRRTIENGRWSWRLVGFDMDKSPATAMNRALAKARRVRDELLYGC